MTLNTTSNTYFDCHKQCINVNTCYALVGRVSTPCGFNIVVVYNATKLKTELYIHDFRSGSFKVIFSNSFELLFAIIMLLLPLLNLH